MAIPAPGFLISSVFVLHPELSATLTVSDIDWRREGPLQYLVSTHHLIMERSFPSAPTFACRLVLSSMSSDLMPLSSNRPSTFAT